MLPLFPHRRLSSALIKQHLRSVREILESGTVMPVDNPYVQQLEHGLSEICRAEHVVCVGSGSAALVLALEALNLPKGSEVITSPFTFQATAAAIVHAGLKPVFADIDLNTMQLSDQQVLAAISAETSALLPVHLCGSLCEILESRHAAAQRGLRVVDDSAQRLGEPALQVDLTCYSLGPTKNIVGYAEGGAIVTSIEGLAERCRILRRNGSIGNFQHLTIGYNAMMDAIPAALLLNHLPYLSAWNERRRMIAKRYDRNLSDLAHIQLVYGDATTTASKYSFYVKDDRDGLFKYLYQELNVEADIYYPTPLHLQPCFRNLGYGPKDFPCAEQASREVLSLPIHDQLSDSEVDYICEGIRNYYGE